MACYAYAYFTYLLTYFTYLLTLLTYFTYLHTYLLYLLVHFKSIRKIVTRLKPYSKLTIEHRASVYEYRVYRLTSIEYRLLMV